MEKNRRSNRIIMTNEARVLRDLRIASKLTMRKAGELVGKSDSYIAHIETGRMDPPQGAKLDSLLTVYGGLRQKSFYERVRKYKKHSTTQDEIQLLLSRATDVQRIQILNFIRSILS